MHSCILIFYVNIPKLDSHDKIFNCATSLWFCFDGHALSLRFLTFLQDSLGLMAWWHSECFVLCPQRGATENCSCKRIYLLSIRMNEAFHHLAALLDWALDETPPPLAFCSTSKEVVCPLVHNLKDCFFPLSSFFSF